MRHSHKLFADSAGLTDHDVARLSDAHLSDAQLSGDGVVAADSQGSRAFHGWVMRHGEITPFTLDISAPIAAPRRVYVEQFAILALVLASFVGPLYQLFS